jgi:hypothetical protein
VDPFKVNAITSPWVFFVVVGSHFFFSLSLSRHQALTVFVVECFDVGWFDAKCRYQLHNFTAIPTATFAALGLGFDAGADTLAVTATCGVTWCDTETPAVT